MHVALLIARLTVGGAEAQTRLLERGLRERGHQVTIVTLFPGGGLAPKPGEDCRHVALCPRLPRRQGLWLPRAAPALRRWLQAERPDVVYSLDLAGNFVAARAAATWESSSEPVPVVWGIRNSGVDMGWKLRFLAWIGGRLPPRTEVIVNGIDTQRFRPDAARRSAARSAWSADAEHVVLGLVARMDPIKGHAVFLEAARRAARVEPRLRFVCATPRAATGSAEVETLRRDPLLAERVRWVIAPDGAEGLYPGFDASVSASSAEAFSNAIVEAMASGLPAVVTDVGDSAWIAGSTGWVVPPGDPQALSEAFLGVAAAGAAERERRGAAARERVCVAMDRESLFRSTEAALASVLASPSGSPRP